MATKVQKSAYSRLFVIRNGAAPSRAPEYFGLVRAGALAWPQGDVTPLRVPSSTQYGAFDTIDQIRGDRGQPTLTVTGRYGTDLSDLFAIARAQCPVDLQVHMGSCQDPRDFNGGYDKVLVVETAFPTNYSTTDLGALEPGQNAMVDEEVPFTGSDAYEIRKLTAAELGQTEIVQNVIAVAICDRRSCGGACGPASDGCQRVFSIQSATAGSPGLPAELVYSSNGGTTLSQTNINSMPVNRNPTDMTCVGSYLVVTSQDDQAIHYALTDDVINGTLNPWTKNSSGVAASGGPNAIFSLGSGFTWAVGNGGYVYFWGDVTATATQQSTGGVTSQNLNAIHGVDTERLVAVGASNALIYTTNGGDTWALGTGPIGAVALNAVWMRSETTWLVGAANGNLYYTENSGLTWTAKSFSGSGSGTVLDIQFATPTVGYMSHATAAAAGAGRIFRTIDGGYSWRIIPASPLSIPANDYIKSLAACPDNVNVVFGGGLADNATDGYFVKLS